MRYQITAMIEDNRENTHKVCAQVDSSFDATDAIIEEICRTQKTTPQAVIETWALLFMHIAPMPEEE